MILSYNDISYRKGVSKTSATVGKYLLRLINTMNLIIYNVPSIKWTFYMTDYNVAAAAILSSTLVSRLSSTFSYLLSSSLITYNTCLVCSCNTTWLLLVGYVLVILFLQGCEKKTHLLLVGTRENILMLFYFCTFKWITEF